MSDSPRTSAEVIRPNERRVAGTESVQVSDTEAVEEPLEIRVEGRSVALTMRTPGDGQDAELALGFLRTEGVLASIDDVLDLDACTPADGGPGNILDVRLRHPERVDLDRLSRHVFTASSCGLCGKATIESVRHRCPERLTPPAVDSATLLALPAALQARQATFQATGGLHAAALFDPKDGQLLVVREDVGRHNAVDKVLGRALLDRRGDLPSLGLLVSGRIAFEIAQKALTAGIGLIAGVSAPTSLAVELAHASGQILVGFLRPDRFNVYAGKLT